MTTTQNPQTEGASIEPLLSSKLDADVEAHEATTRAHGLEDPANLVEPGPDDCELPMHDGEPQEHETAPSRSNNPLTEILQPLVDLLESRYPLAVRWELVDHIDRDAGMIRLASNMAGIAFFPNRLTTLAARALAAVLRLSQTDGLSEADRPSERPLLFRVLREARALGSVWWPTGYLVADYEGELDVEAATRQVARLVAHLSDPHNLVALTRKERVRLI